MDAGRRLAAVLRRSAKEKQLVVSAVAVHKPLNSRPPTRLRHAAQRHQIAGRFPPGVRLERDMDLGQVVKSSQDAVGTPKAKHNCR